MPRVARSSSNPNATTSPATILCIAPTSRCGGTALALACDHTRAPKAAISFSP